MTRSSSASVIVVPGDHRAGLHPQAPALVVQGLNELEPTPRVKRALRLRQLHVLQCPRAQLHTGAVIPALRGPHRRTHSSPTASVRSPMPPGQDRPNIAEASRFVSRSVRADTDWTCAASSEARGSRDIRPLSASLRHRITFARPRRLAYGARRRQPGVASGGLRNPRDAFLIERHVSRDSLVGHAVD